MIKNHGAFVVARQFFESELWLMKPASWGKIWLYIFGKVHHETDKHFERGSGFFNFSRELKLIGPDITYDNIRHALHFFKMSTMISTKKTTRGIIIKVLNYNKFQTLSNYKSTIESTSSSTRKAQQKHNRSTTIDKYGKNDKNDNNTPLPPKGGSESEEINLNGSKNNKLRGGTQNLEIVKGVEAEEIQEVLNVFYEDAKANNVEFRFGHRGYRKAVEELILSHGVGQVVAVAKIAIGLRGVDQFAPSITSPFDLRDKWMKLVAYGQRQAIEPPKKIGWVTCEY